MKSDLRISTGAVRTAADRISGEKERMECEFQELQERISGALNSWLSEASENMAGKFSDIRERCCLSFFPGIQEYTRALRISAGEGYEAAELKTGPSFRGFRISSDKAGIGGRMLLEIDLVRLREAAASVEIYLESMKKHMNRSDAELQALGLTWNGPDYEAFQNGWMKLCGPGSVCHTCFLELRDFADCLHFAEEQYAKLQRDAAEQAEKLLHI